MATLTVERPHVGWSFWLQWVFLIALFLSLSYTGIDLVLRPIVERSVRDPWVQEAIIVVGLAILGRRSGWRSGCSCAGTCIGLARGVWSSRQPFGWAPA